MLSVKQSGMTQPGIEHRSTNEANEPLLKFATLVEDDQKAPFSIATTLRCEEGRYSFPWIAPLYPWYVPYIAEC